MKVSKSILVIVIAVNIDANVPIVNVTANPFTGPVPKVKRITVIINVVRFESKIATNPLLNPASIALRIVFPNLSSSFILSNIITFASTAIPADRISPAIPGRVSVASIKLRQPKVISPNIIRAIFATIPGSL